MLTVFCCLLSFLLTVCLISSTLLSFLLTVYLVSYCFSILIIFFNYRLLSFLLFYKAYCLFHLPFAVFRCLLSFLLTVCLVSYCLSNRIIFFTYSLLTLFQSLLLILFHGSLLHELAFSTIYICSYYNVYKHYCYGHVPRS